MAQSTQTMRNSMPDRRAGVLGDVWSSLADDSKPYSIIIRLGSLAGIILLYIGAIGMIQAFDSRQVIRSVLTLGQLVLFAPALLAGFTIVRRLSTTNNIPTAIIGAVVVGLLTTIPTILVMALNTRTNVASMFVNINRQWLDIITFDNRADLLSGSLLLIGWLVGAALVGGVWSLLPGRYRRALILGISLTLAIGVMSETVRLILQEIFSREFLNNFFQRNTMLPRTAVGLFAIGTVLSLSPTAIWRSLVFGIITALAVIGTRNLIETIPGAPALPSSESGTLDAVLYFIMPLVVATAARLYAEYGPRAGSKNGHKTRAGQQLPISRAEYIVLLVILLVVPWLVGRALSDVLVTIGLFALMGLGLNIAIGLAGLLDLGYVTNYAVGAYVMAVLTSTGPLGRGFLIFDNFWMVIPITLLAALFAGFFFALPVLKMRGDYLAIATLGFGEIIGRLAISDAMAPLIGGAQGVLFVPKPVFFGTELVNPEQLYYVILGACLITLLISVRLNNSRTGRQWMAIREDEDVAAAMGINVPLAKLLAFTLSAATGGVAGAIFAAKVGTVFPNTFTVIVSINVLSLIIVGGLASNPGIVVGAVVLVGLPELLREFSDFRWLLYGILLIWMMINRPEGLIPSKARQRELHEVDESLLDQTVQAAD